MNLKIFALPAVILAGTVLALPSRADCTPCCNPCYSGEEVPYPHSCDNCVPWSATAGVTCCGPITVEVSTDPKGVLRAEIDSYQRQLDQATKDRDGIQRLVDTLAGQVAAFKAALAKVK